MDWSKGFSASYYMCIVDPVTWRDTGMIKITEGSIDRTDSNLRESANISCTGYDSMKEQWIRVWLDARQGGAAGHVALFTGLAISPDEDINGRLSSHTLECYSVLKPAEDILLPRGWYAPAEISCVPLLKTLLSVTPAPVVVADNAPSLQNAIVAEDGETNLSMAEKIISAIGWEIRITGDGTIYALPESAKPVAMFDALENDSIEPQLKKTKDWYACPNVFRAVSDDLMAVARDDSENSPLSTINRGREVWMEETDCDLSEDESIADYAMRRLREEQSTALVVSYDRRYHPDVLVGDYIRLHYPAQGLDGLYQVQSQSIELGYGCRTSEEVKA